MVEVEGKLVAHAPVIDRIAPLRATAGSARLGVASLGGRREGACVPPGAPSCAGRRLLFAATALPARSPDVTPGHPTDSAAQPVSLCSQAQAAAGLHVAPWRAVRGAVFAPLCPSAQLLQRLDANLDGTRERVSP